jgi:hypothetical protein
MSNYALPTMGNLSWSMGPTAAKWSFRWKLNEVDRRKAHEADDQTTTGSARFVIHQIGFETRGCRPIPEFGGCILRVACVETNSNIRIISVMFDRNARRKP